ncbi:MAG TPA: ATP synthase F0 subunit B [Candidatus Angelobacter sp.]
MTAQYPKSTAESPSHGERQAWVMLAVFALLFTFLSLPTAVRAQEPQHPQSSASSAPAQESTTADKTAQAGKEPEGDSNDQFRHSGSIKAIARMTGLSLDTTYWLCVVLNFIVVFAVLWFFLRKALPAVFRNRTEAIQRRLEEARKTSEEARRRLSEVEARLSRLDTEIAQMRHEAEASGKTEEEHMMAAAEEERRRIVESAEQEISSAAAAARRELKAYTAELAVSLAEKKIRISESTDEQLVRSFASRLGKDEN